MEAGKFQNFSGYGDLDWIILHPLPGISYTAALNSVNMMLYQLLDVMQCQIRCNTREWWIGMEVGCSNHGLL
jgi:hypothetical protein